MTLHLRPAAAQHLERAQPLQHVQEIGVQAAEGAPLAAGGSLGLIPDQDHKNGDQRRGEQQHQPGERVDGEDEEQEGERHQGCQGKLGQVLGVVGVQGFDALGGGCHQLAAALLAGKCRTQGEEALHELAAQVQLEAAGKGAGCHVAPPDQNGAQQDERQQQRQRTEHLPQGSAAQEDLGDHPAGLLRLEDGENPGAEAQQDGEGKEQPRPAAQGGMEQAMIQVQRLSQSCNLLRSGQVTVKPRQPALGIYATD